MGLPNQKMALLLQVQALEVVEVVLVAALVLQRQDIHTKPNPQ
jgi:hypothetical protein